MSWIVSKHFQNVQEHKHFKKCNRLSRNIFVSIYSEYFDCSQTNLNCSYTILKCSWTFSWMFVTIHFLGTFSTYSEHFELFPNNLIFFYITLCIVSETILKCSRTFSDFLEIFYTLSRKTFWFVQEQFDLLKNILFLKQNIF